MVETSSGNDFHQEVKNAHVHWVEEADVPNGAFGGPSEAPACLVALRQRLQPFLRDHSLCCHPGPNTGRGVPVFLFAMCGSGLSNQP